MKHTIKFSTKADTLTQFRPLALSCDIPKFDSFSLQDWKTDKNATLQKITKRFSTLFVAVRSSAVCEDGANNSYAGAFESILNVDPSDKEQLTEAIETVFASFPDQNPNDQVLIQEMVTDIDVSGVILTRCVDDGSPYYVLSRP